MAIKEAKVVAISSVKGGTGKTTVTLNLAGAISKKNKKVLIIDLDLYGSAVAASLNVSNDQDIYKLIDDLNNNRFNHIADYTFKYNDFIDVLPAPKDPRFAKKIGNRYLNIVFNRAKLIYDIILIDTNHILDDVNLVTFDLVDELLYVLSTDPIDIKNMKTMVSIFKDMDRTNYKIILNKAKDKLNNQFSDFEIKSLINSNIDFVIPSELYIKNFDKYTLEGIILTLDKKVNNTYKKAIKVFDDIANYILKKEK